MEGMWDNFYDHRHGYCFFRWDSVSVRTFLDKLVLTTEVKVLSTVFVLPQRQLTSGLPDMVTRMWPHFPRKSHTTISVPSLLWYQFLVWPALAGLLTSAL
jgi:hypothetical protein